MRFFGGFLYVDLFENMIYFWGLKVIEVRYENGI